MCYTSAEILRTRGLDVVHTFLCVALLRQQGALLISEKHLACDAAKQSLIKLAV
jgi:hypothetical protein